MAAIIIVAIIYLFNMKPVKIIAITAGVLIFSFFIYGIFKLIEQFEEFSAISIPHESYSLKAKEIRVINTRTKKIDTLQFKGIKLINFWATWCAPCLKEQPSLEKLQNLYPEKIAVIQFSNDSINKQIQLINNYNWNLPA